MKEEKIYNVRYSESKGKIKLYLEPKKLVFKKTKGLFKKETRWIEYNGINTNKKGNWI